MLLGVISYNGVLSECGRRLPTRKQGGVGVTRKQNDPEAGGWGVTRKQAGSDPEAGWE